MKNNQRYIPDILEDILKELKKLNKDNGTKGPKGSKKKVDPEIEATIDNGDKDNKKIEKRPLPTENGEEKR